MDKSFMITAEYGIHARPATRLVNLAMSFQSEIYINAFGKTVNLKSIMGLMSLGIYKGELIKIIARGNDAEKAMAAFSEFIADEKLGKSV